MEVQGCCESNQVFCLLNMNFWIPGASDPGVDREYEDEGSYLVNDTQNRISIEQQVSDSFCLILNVEKEFTNLQVPKRDSVFPCWMLEIII